MSGSDWHGVDISGTVNLVGFRAEDRDGNALDLTDDPREPIFVRSDGNLWSADSFLGFYLQKSGTKIEDYIPPSLADKPSDTVDFTVTIEPPGSFHVETDKGPVDVAVATPQVEFRRSQQ